jgi:phosphoribosyl-AMP cyclohydrolase
MNIDFSKNGLKSAIIQDSETNAVLCWFIYMNAEAYQKNIDTKSDFLAVKIKLWTKEESGNFEPD